LNNDDLWDDEFSFNKITSTQFSSTGLKTIKAQVRDRQGGYAIRSKDIMVIDNGPSLANTAHPMFRNTTSHSGISAYDGPITTTIKWSFAISDTTGAVAASPSIGAGGTIYIGSFNSVLYAIDPVSGNEIWKRNLAGPVYSSVAIAADGTLYLGAGSYLYIIDPSDGSDKYPSYNTGSSVRSSPVIDADGTVYIGSLNNKLYAVNYDGSFKWSFSTQGQIWSSPAIGPDGTLYVGSLDNKLYAINQNSTLKWSYFTAGGIYGSPVVGADGVVYVGSFDNYFYAINSDGTLKWKFLTGGQIWSSAALKDGKVYFGSDDGNLYCLDANGTKVWTYPAGSRIRSSPTLDKNNKVYFGADNGKLYALNSSGLELNSDWPIDLSGPKEIRSSVAIGNTISPTLYVGSNARAVYAIGADVLDPAELYIQKSANKTTVSIGDVITYKIIIANKGVDPTTSTATTIIDAIPMGFKYLIGSTILDGVRQPDPSGESSLIFDVGHFTPGESKTLSYQLVVGSGVGAGKYVNRAYAHYYYDSPVIEATSPIAQSEVWVVPEPLFGLGTIIGKVFWDKNANGIQDKDEHHYDEAEIITEDGTIIRTDSNGNYHIPNVKPGNHILHLKNISKDWLTTDNPQIVRVTAGILAKANFGIKPQDTPMNIRASPLPFIKDLTLVASGEGTLGWNKSRGEPSALHYSGVRQGDYSDGNFAYYISGTIDNKFVITSSLDTQRNPAKAGQIPYLDPDKYYPEYGDNSKVEFANTQTHSPLYLKIDSLPDAKLGKSTFLWGIYQTEINNTELANYNRTLGGAKITISELPLYNRGHLKASTSADLFVAQNNQKPAHNEFRATGGSFYYLKHKDIIVGSERITVQSRDKFTDLIISTSQFIRDKDYSIDYSHGRIILQKPLSLVETTDTITSNDIPSGNSVYLVVDYEYAINNLEIQEGTYGVRVSGQVQDNRNNKLQLALTYIRENKERDYELKGVDVEHIVTTKFIPLKWTVSGEHSQSVSRGPDGFISSDGGLGFNNITSFINTEGVAYKVKLGISGIDKLDPCQSPPSFESYYQQVDPGFTSSTSYNYQGSLRYGYLMSFPTWTATHCNSGPDWKHSTLRINIRYDAKELLRSPNIISKAQIGADKTETTTIQGIYQKEKWTITNEFLYQEATRPFPNITANANEDIFLGSAKINYVLSEQNKVYFIQQATLKGEPNNQTTLGIMFGLSKNIYLSLQGTSGSRGDAFSLGMNNKISDRTETSSNLSIHTNGSVRSVQTAQGVSHQLTDSTKLYAQNEQENSKGLSQNNTILGQDTNLSNKWFFSINAQQGIIHKVITDSQTAETTRQSVSGRIKYDVRTKLVLDSKLETSFESARKNQSNDRHQYLTANTIRYQLTQDTTFSGRLNYFITENEDTNTKEASFSEYGLGFALRPVKWDRWHLLAKYTNLKDIYPQSQSASSISVTKDISNIYALETAYDISKYLQVVEKYGHKNQTEKTSSHPETENNLYLWINRINYNVIRQYYAGVEYRILKQVLGEDKNTGFLIELSHKTTENIHLSVGYNFTDFSDDLKNNSYSCRGFFIRINTVFSY
jgi:uncharacterized repeat protein (TIGR01451 family)